MNLDTLEEAVSLSRTLGYFIIASADLQGSPHVAPAEQMNLIPEQKKVTVETWFCPGTLGNLQSNHQVSVVVWDAVADRGYQILGEAGEVEDVTLLDGYLPGTDSFLPQGKKRIYIRVNKVLSFQHAPHTDQESS